MRASVRARHDTGMPMLVYIDSGAIEFWPANTMHSRSQRERQFPLSRERERERG